MLTTDDLARLRRAIEQAEHKPGEWATSGLAMGVAVKAGTESLSAGTGAIALTVQEGQRVGAFPYKRDGWLAVAAVNALPELLRVYEAVLAAEAASDTILSRLEGWGKAYPVDMFSEPTEADREWLHATRPGLMDRIAASMGRHMAGCIDGDVKALRQRLGRLVPLATAKGESNG